MAPTEVTKATPKVQRNVQTNPIKPVTKSIAKKSIQRIPLRTANKPNTVPVAATPKPKEKKVVPAPASAVKSAKKSTKKRVIKPAHSGVPLPAAMRRMVEKYSRLDESL